MHTMKVVVVDPSGRTVPLADEGIPTLVEARLARLPMLRRRIIPAPHGLEENGVEFLDEARADRQITEPLQPRLQRDNVVGHFPDGRFFRSVGRTKIK